jgi:hypothetical protein
VGRFVLGLGELVVSLALLLHGRYVETRIISWIDVIDTSTSILFDLGDPEFDRKDGSVLASPLDTPFGPVARSAMRTCCLRFSVRVERRSQVRPADRRLIAH